MGVKWFAKLTVTGKVTAIYKTEWQGKTLVEQAYWDTDKNVWLPTSDVTYSLKVWDNDIEEVKFTDIEHLLPAVAKSVSITKAGVPSELEMERALSRLEILPNPNHPELENPENFVESPWVTVPAPQVNPNVWDNAVLDTVALDELKGTDLWMKRKNIRKHIEAMGQALTQFRSYALIVEKDGDKIIIDGHHRLFAQWLLGQDKAPVWIVKN